MRGGKDNRNIIGSSPKESVSRKQKQEQSRWKMTNNDK